MSDRITDLVVDVSALTLYPHARFVHATVQGYLAVGQLVLLPVLALAAVRASIGDAPALRALVEQDNVRVLALAEDDWSHLGAAAELLGGDLPAGQVFIEAGAWDAAVLTMTPDRYTRWGGVRAVTPPL